MIEIIEKSPSKFFYRAFNKDKDGREWEIDCNIEFENSEIDKECTLWNIFHYLCIQDLGISKEDFDNLKEKAHEEFKAKNGFYPYKKIIERIKKEHK